MIVLQWRLPDTAVDTRWVSQPTGQLTDVAAIIGPPGADGQDVLGVFVQATRPTQQGPWLWVRIDGSGNALDLIANDGNN